MIKKLIVIVTSILLFSCTHHTQKPQTIYSNWSLEKRAVQEKNIRPDYTISANYPEVTADFHNPTLLSVNRHIQQFIMGRIEKFKTVVPEDTLNLRDFPPEMRINELEIQYYAHITRGDLKNILSIRFHVEKRISGHTETENKFSVVNYDLNTNKEISLASLFRPESNYLEVISLYCKRTLQKRLTQGMPWLTTDSKALAPLEKNFEIWTLDEKGIWITLQEWQVSPYSPHEEKVLIPYTALRSVLL